MARAPMSQAEFNAAPRVTPSKLGDPRLKQHQPMPRGPAGLPVPRPTAICQPKDRKLLYQIARVAVLRAHEVEHGQALFPGCHNQFEHYRRAQDRAGTIAMWPGQFRVSEGRHPRWREIEQAWPAVAAWLAEQRLALANQAQEPDHG